MRSVWTIVIALFFSGCLRVSFDRCTEAPPHPECAALDAGRDAGALDAAADGAASDAPLPSDGPSEGDASTGDGPPSDAP